ncbi:MAG: tyrosine-type recombinase/integrase [Acidobacteria bacterium]|nr:tyrosine-type recombinase/integrase [Acidobacteriota bacterium]
MEHQTIDGEWEPVMDVGDGGTARRAEVLPAAVGTQPELDLSGLDYGRLRALEEAGRETDLAALAPNTRRSYRAALRGIDGWLAEVGALVAGLGTGPAWADNSPRAVALALGEPAQADAALALYVQARAEAGDLPQSLRPALAALRRVASERGRRLPLPRARDRLRALGRPDRMDDDTRVDLLAAREQPDRLGRWRRSGRAAALGPEGARTILGRLRATAERERRGRIRRGEADKPPRGRELRALRDAALIRLGLVAGLRISELWALKAEDLAETPCGWQIRVRRSKTSPEPAQVALDAATAATVKAWTDAAGIASGPLWRPVGRARAAAAGDGPAPGVMAAKLDRGRALSRRAILDALKARAAECRGLPGVPATVSGHSLRRGAVQHGLDDPAVADDAVRRHVRHASPATTARYSERAATWEVAESIGAALEAGA